MEISQPVQEQIDLEHLKNQITMGEGELARLRALQESEKYGISELVKERKWHTDEIERLLSEKDNLNRQIDRLESNLKDAEETISEAENVKREHESRVKSLEDDKVNHLLKVNQDLTSLQERENDLYHRESIHKSNISELNDYSIKLSEKEAKIKAFADELSK